MTSDSSTAENQSYGREDTIANEGTIVNKSAILNEGAVARISSFSDPYPSEITPAPQANFGFWERGLSKLADELDPQVFSAYIQPLKPRAYDKESGEFEVLAPSTFIRNQVERNLREKISKALNNEIEAQYSGCCEVNVKLVVAPTSLSEGALHTVKPPLARQHIVVKKVRQAPSSNGNSSSSPLFPGAYQQSSAASSNLYSAPFVPHGLNPRYTFSTFVVGNSNQFCHAAALRVAENPGVAYNPFFIYGGVGLGKTHILHAIGNAVLAKNPLARVVYMSSESFTNQLIMALKNGGMEDFKNRMRSVQVLLIDDIQFMCGKERTQEEFFHTFNSLYNSKHQIIITSDKLPQEIPMIEERLQTRFSWGLTADMQSPDLETRIAILKHKAATDRFDLPNDVAHFIAERISSNVRELEGALTRLHAMSSLRNVPIDLDLTLSALKPLLQTRVVSVSVEDIKTAVALHFNLKVSDLTCKRRSKNLAFPRHIAMYLCRKHTQASFPEIGSSFGGRDHSSVIHAAGVISSKISSDSEVKELVSVIERRLFS